VAGRPIVISQHCKTTSTPARARERGESRTFTHSRGSDTEQVHFIGKDIIYFTRCSGRNAEVHREVFRNEACCRLAMLTYCRSDRCSPARRTSSGMKSEILDVCIQLAAM